MNPPLPGTLRQGLHFGLLLFVGMVGSIRAAAPAIRIERTDGTVLVHFNGALQGASRVEGPYRRIAGAASPLVASAGDPQQFWRAVLPGVSTIAAGLYHTVAVRADGTLWSWGTNSHGQLGNGTFASTNAPQQIGTENTWLAVVAGDYYTMALRADGTLWAWGDNYIGQLGNGTFGGQSNTPQQIASGTNWQTVSAGRDHCVALRDDGSLWTWGGNPEGQLGNGSYASSNVPRPIEPATTWRSVTAGSGHTAAVLADGTLWTWGDNREGQLGNGTFTIDFSHGLTTPQQIGTDTTWRAVSARGDYTLALRDDGTLWAWGENWAGQLGNGVIGRMTQPQQIGSDTNWETIVAGLMHSAALRIGGRLWGWGANSYGQVGIGSVTTNAAFALTTPQPVVGDTAWLSAAAGLEHTVALRADGTLWAWGLNAAGQLGDGTVTNRPSPVQVLGGAVWGTPRR